MSYLTTPQYYTNVSYWYPYSVQGVADPTNPEQIVEVATPTSPPAAQTIAPTPLPTAQTIAPTPLPTAQTIAPTPLPTAQTTKSSKPFYKSTSFIVSMVTAGLTLISIILFIYVMATR